MSKVRGRMNRLEGVGRGSVQQCREGKKNWKQKVRRWQWDVLVEGGGGGRR